MSQVRLVRSGELSRHAMVNNPLTGNATFVDAVETGEGERLDIWLSDGTVIRNSHPLTLWRLR